MDNNGHSQRPDSPALNVRWGLGMLILLLTLAVWIFFYVERMPLDAAGTSVVALLMTLLVWMGRWCWLRLRRRADVKRDKAEK